MAVCDEEVKKTAAPLTSVDMSEKITKSGQDQKENVQSTFIGMVKEQLISKVKKDNPAVADGFQKKIVQRTVADTVKEQLISKVKNDNPAAANALEKAKDINELRKIAYSYGYKELFDSLYSKYQKQLEMVQQSAQQLMQDNMSNILRVITPVPMKEKDEDESTDTIKTEEEKKIEEKAATDTGLKVDGNLDNIKNYIGAMSEDARKQDEHIVMEILKLINDAQEGTQTEQNTAKKALLSLVESNPRANAIVKASLQKNF